MVSHLYGQTRRFTVWVNGKNKSEIANFHLNDRIYITIVYKSLPLTEKRPRTPETWDGLEHLESEMVLKKKTTNSVPFETFRREVYRCLSCRTL